MIRLMVLVLVVLVAVWVSACSPKVSGMTAREAVSKVSEGMSPADVTDLLGTPDVNKDLGGGKRVCAFTASDRKVVVFFEGGEVADVRATDVVQFR
ncbi:hypothetical protein ACFL59_13570 [Planctomycetota bacterium]